MSCRRRIIVKFDLKNLNLNNILNIKNIKLNSIKKTQRILLIVSCVAFVFGVIASTRARDLAARDVSKIHISIIEKDSYRGPDASSYLDDCYHIVLTYRIENNTKVDWSYLKTITYVYDKNGISIGNISTEFGSAYGESNFRLKAGDVTVKTTELTSQTLKDFFSQLYNCDIQELKFESEIVGGRYFEK